MKTIGVYLRLSLEDAQYSGKDESNSISSQRLMIREFIRKDPELKEYEIKEFCDDGYSGTGMDRPGMNQLLDEVKKNRIQCIIVKDMSRFSRDYIEMGTYLNQIFPFMDVRFIALNDRYDSRENNGNTIGIDTAFKTLLYDLYSKDLSVKVKSSFANKCANGEYVFGQVPFGYKKSPEEKNKIIVDEKEAEIVRYIFSLAMEKKSSTQIARQLHGEGIPTVMQMRRPDKYAKDGKAHAWSAGAVRNILNNRFYLGEMTYGKRAVKSIGSQKIVKRPKEEWKVLQDHHEALTTPEIYSQVSSFHPDKTTKRKREKHPITGKLYCGGCGYAMIYRPLRGKDRRRQFSCWKHAMLQIPECCVSFDAAILEELILTMINKELILRGEAISQEKSLHILNENQSKEVEKQIGRLRRERGLLQASLDHAYEEYTIGRMTAEEYREKADNESRQVEALGGQIRSLEEELLELKEREERMDADMKQIIKFSHMEELTQELLDTFIDRIYAYKDKRVEIKWRFRER